MQIIETRQYEMLVRVNEFGNTHGNLFPESSPGGKEFAIVAGAVKALGRHDFSKVSALALAHEGASTRATARAALVGQLGAISRTARVIANARPGFDAKFRLPSPETGQALVTTRRYGTAIAG